MARITTTKKPRARDLMEVIVLLLTLFTGVRYDYELLTFIATVYTVASCLGLLLGCAIATIRVTTAPPERTPLLNGLMRRCRPDDWWHAIHTTIWCWCGIIFIHSHHPTIAMFAIFHPIFLMGWWYWIVGYSDCKLREGK